MRSIRPRGATYSAPTKAAAAELAWQLRAARAWIVEEQPRRCVDCGVLFTMPAGSSEQRCATCEERTY